MKMVTGKKGYGGKKEIILLIIGIIVGIVISCLFSATTSMICPFIPRPF